MDYLEWVLSASSGPFDLVDEISEPLEADVLNTEAVGHCAPAFLDHELVPTPELKATLPTAASQSEIQVRLAAIPRNPL